MRRSLGIGFHTPASNSWGPYVYVELGRFRLHMGARRFGMPWQSGFGAWFGVYWTGRWHFYRRVGA